MSDRAVKRNIGTLQNELQYIEGQVVITGPQGAVGSGIAVNGLTGSLPTVLSGSTPYQFVDQLTVVQVESGSYALHLADVYPRLLSAQFTVGFATGSIFSFDKSVVQTTDCAPRYDTASEGGVNQVGFAILSGSVLASPEPGEVVTVNVSLALANSSV